MIEISNSAAQTLEVGQAILFDVTNLRPVAPPNVTVRA